MRSVLRAVAFLLLSPIVCGAQRPTPSNGSTSDVLARMKSRDWIERYKGFEEAAMLLQSGQEGTQDKKDDLRLGLIQLLVTETASSEDRSTIVNDEDLEGYSNYLGDLIGAVADLKDERAIPVLLANAPTGRMATRGVAHFGTKALEPTLHQAMSEDAQLAQGAFFVIMDMLEFRTVDDSDSFARIKNALRSTLTRPEYNLRMVAINVIEYLNDREEFVPLLRDLATSDPFKIQGQVDADGHDIGEVYPVRGTARLLLVKIVNHEAPIIDKGAGAP